MSNALFEGDEHGWGSYQSQTPMCHHRMDKVELVNGITLYASAHHAIRGEDEIRPDFGCYLDQVWKPDCIAFYTHWQDFGLPTLPIPKFIEFLEFVLDYAEKWAVEVGCIGGHGRTGTALVCMAVIAGETPEEAMERVKSQYCERVMETEEQRWLVHAVHAALTGIEPPPKPDPPKFKSSYSTPKNWKEEGNGEKGEGKGTTAKINTDSTGQEYCSNCQCDIPTPETTECIWCEATVEGRKK